MCGTVDGDLHPSNTDVISSGRIHQYFSEMTTDLHFDALAGEFTIYETTRIRRK